ncbi:hypothetical protein MTO96_013674 [Rhipicephalus appendiculatus]
MSLASTVDSCPPGEVNRQRYRSSRLDFVDRRERLAIHFGADGDGNPPSTIHVFRRKFQHDGISDGSLRSAA